MGGGYPLKPSFKVTWAEVAINANDPGLFCTKKHLTNGNTNGLLSLPRNETYKKTQSLLYVMICKSRHVEVFCLVHHDFFRAEKNRPLFKKHRSPSNTSNVISSGPSRKKTSPGFTKPSPETTLRNEPRPKKPGLTFPLNPGSLKGILISWCMK